ncbi:MAG: hypothetical protein VYE53_06550, partial [Planctomycetota bacterium]|nr:hypothetical protein [Planctomycetota bacterium]
STVLIPSYASPCAILVALSCHAHRTEKDHRRPFGDQPCGTAMPIMAFCRMRGHPIAVLPPPLLSQV